MKTFRVARTLLCVVLLTVGPGISRAEAKPRAGCPWTLRVTAKSNKQRSSIVCRRQGNRLSIEAYAGDPDESRVYKVPNDPNNARGVLWTFKTFRPSSIRSPQFGSFVFRFTGTRNLITVNGDGEFTLNGTPVPKA
jgi:hypothetical protein